MLPYKILEKDYRYYFFPANQQKVKSEIYSLTQYDLIVNGCDWHSLVGNDGKIVLHCLTRRTYNILLSSMFEIPLNIILCPVHILDFHILSLQTTS